MRITFIGTSYGRPLPHRRCSCYMIETGGKIYFVDMGTMALEDLIDRGADLSKVAGIFITHMHGDHANGLPQFMHMTNGHIKNCDPAVFLPSRNAIDGINAWLELIDIEPRQRDYRVVREGEIFNDGNIRVEAMKTAHTSASYGYMIEAEGKTVAFVSDLVDPDIDFPKQLCGRHLGLIVLEAQHFHPKKYLPHLAGLTAEKIAFTHYANTQYGRIVEFCDIRDYDRDVIAAHDGMVIDV